MSDESSLSSSDDDCYVNAAFKYKKAVTKKLNYIENEDDKIPDFYSDKCQSPISSIQKEELNQKSCVISEPFIEDGCFNKHKQKKIPTNSSDGPSKKKCVRKKRHRLSDMSNEPTSSNMPPSLSSMRMRSRKRNLEPICLDDSIPESDIIWIGSPEDKRSENENYSINVKIIWKSKDIVKLDINRYEPVQKMFKHFAQMEGVPEEHILITRKDIPIKPTDTPVSLGLSIIDILEADIVSKTMLTDKIEVKNGGEGEICKIKVQSDNKKQSFFINLRKNENFNLVVSECAQKFQVSPENIKLYFDGDQIQMDETPDSLDLEQEACVDLRILNK